LSLSFIIPEMKEEDGLGYKETAVSKGYTVG
jgi:hypothetical protein